MELGAVLVVKVITIDWYKTDLTSFGMLRGSVNYVPAVSHMGFELLRHLR